MEGVGRAKVVEGAGDRASIGAGEIGGIQMDASCRMPDRSCDHSDGQRQS